MIHRKFAEVKQYAAELADKQLSDELLQLIHSSEDHTSEPYLRRKQQLVTKLARLVPGATHSIGAIQSDGDTLATTATDIADVLKRYWDRVFKSQPVDGQLLKSWLDTTPNFMFNQSRFQDYESNKPSTPCSATSRPAPHHDSPVP